MKKAKSISKVKVYIPNLTDKYSLIMNCGLLSQHEMNFLANKFGVKYVYFASQTEYKDIMKNVQKVTAVVVNENKNGIMDCVLVKGSTLYSVIPSGAPSVETRNTINNVISSLNRAIVMANNIKIKKLKKTTSKKSSEDKSES